MADEPNHHYRYLAKGYRFLAEGAKPEAKHALLTMAGDFDRRALEKNPAENDGEEATTAEHQPLTSLTSKLERLAELNDLDRQSIQRLPWTAESVGPGHELVVEGSEPSDCCLLVSGYACRYKVLRTGERQIVSFHLAGEIVDLELLHLSIADHHVESVTSAHVAWIPKESLMAMTRQRPALAEALWRHTLIDASIFREWVLNVGRRDAVSRVAHMLCELAIRCQSAGLCSADDFEWPMTKEQIADATALAPAAVARTLESLANVGALNAHGGTYRIEDWAQLKQVAEFDDAYLHAVAA